MITATSIGTGGLGRFGNQMFTIAGVIGIAIKSGQPFGFPKWRNYDNALFGGTVDDFSEFFENHLPSSDGLQFNEYGYFWGYRDIHLPMGNWSINAHLQSGKFFEHCLDTVRHYFRMKDEKKRGDGYVAVHYRAGDYIDDVRAYHPRQQKEYYEKAMSFFPSWTTFVVFTDDQDEAFKIFGHKVQYRSKECTYIDDFRDMKGFKSFIIANSSFSAMAAHLGEHPEKKVVAPKLWFGEQANGMDASDIYNKDWIVI